MPIWFHHFFHLFVQIVVRWYTFLGTSPGGIAAQILTLVLTEVQGGWWRLENWKNKWQGGLKRAFYALGAVWLFFFIVCTMTTIYDDHLALVGTKAVLAGENRELRTRNSDLQDENTRLKSASPKVMTRTVEPGRQCWVSNHFGMPNSTINGAVTATAVIVRCNYKIDAPFKYMVEFDRDFIPGAMVLADSGGWSGGAEQKQGRVCTGQVSYPALLSNQLVIVTVYGATDQFPRVVRASIEALK